MSVDDVLFDPVSIGSLTVPHRIIRAGTGETLATEEGYVTEGLISVYERLAKGGAGLMFTGHMYVHPTGKASSRQTGIWEDACVDGLAHLTERVHASGGLVFAQLGHAGTQSRWVDDLVGPSSVPNLLSGRSPREGASPDLIRELIEAFGDAARRAVEAGFDGVHVHGANGYLISSFSSPITNRRDDVWGGDRQRRGRFAAAIVESVRDNVPASFPVTMKLGFVDPAPEGLELEEALERASHLAALGVDAIEVSSNLMSVATDSARLYVGLDRWAAIKDLIFDARAAEDSPEAYFAGFSSMLKEKVDVPVILVGGIRSPEVMRRLVHDGACDFVAMARPFIREPDLVQKIRAGKSSMTDCTSCNLCFSYSGREPLRCWRKPRRALARHLVNKLVGRAP